MNTETYLARTLTKTESEAQYDECAKSLASDKQVLARILKCVVPEYQDMNVAMIERCIEGNPEVSKVPLDKIIGTNTESTIAHEGTIYYDIRFSTYIPSLYGKVKILLNLEIQREFYLPYDLTTRGIFYCARMLSEQLDTEFVPTHYDDIKKVYSIWICTDTSKKTANTISSYALERNDLYGAYKEKERYDLLEMIMIRMSEQEVMEQGNELIRMLIILFSHKLNAEEKKQYLQKDYGMRMTRKMKGWIDEMCNLSLGIREDGIREGFQQGEKHGFQQGEKVMRMLIARMTADNLLELIPRLSTDEAFFEEMKLKYNMK